MDIGLGHNQHAASVYASIHLRQWIARHSSSLRFVILNRDGLRAEGGRSDAPCIIYRAAASLRGGAFQRHFSIFLTPPRMIGESSRQEKKPWRLDKRC